MTSAGVKSIGAKNGAIAVSLAFLVGLHLAQASLLSIITNLNNYPSSTTLKDGDTYEYIVVGAGAAGCAAAARLAEAGYRVLLVEAGSNPNIISKIPLASLGLLGSDSDWQYETISNNVSCLASQGEQCRFSRGKGLGGSTNINYMLYTRGNREDFNYNITGWTWDQLEPYFLRYEGLKVLDQFPSSSAKYHNTTGNMQMEYFDDPQNPWHARLMEGLQSLNIPYNGDVNGESQIGVTKSVGYVYNGERMSASSAYLNRNSKVTVAKTAHCTGVIIDDNNVALGVTLVQGSSNVTLNIYAEREVVLSAGTVGTPQILMLSGIGPAEHLQQMNIPVRVNLTVGDNMTDHVLPFMVVLVDQTTNVVSDLAALAGLGIQAAEFLATVSGPMASNGLTDITAFLNMDCYDSQNHSLRNDSTACQQPTVQMIHTYMDRNLVPLARSLVQHAVGFNDEVFDQIAAANDNYGLLIVSPVVLKPYSYGNIRLASSNPLAPPAIFPNYLSDARDVDEMMKAIRIVEDLVATPSFQANNASILHLKLSGCPDYAADDEAYWRCYGRYLTYAVYHAVGTCALGRVVDENLRVYGVERLRAADLSVLPTLPRGNTEAIALALGERVVDFLLDAATSTGSTAN